MNIPLKNDSIPVEDHKPRSNVDCDYYTVITVLLPEEGDSPSIGGGGTWQVASSGNSRFFNRVETVSKSLAL
jgi:hypothetical protein